MTGKKKTKLSTWQYLKAIAAVSRESFSIAPSAGVVRVVDSIIQAALPIATTFFAALTTTALAEAYAGDESAGDRVMLYVLATAAIGILTLLWNSVSSYVDQKTRYVIEAAVEDRMMNHFAALPFALYDDKDVVDEYEKARRFSYFFSYIFSTVGSMAVSVFGGIGALVALFFVNPWLALAVTIAIVPGVVIQVRLARSQAAHWEGNITNRRRRSNMGWTLKEPRYIAEMRVYGVAKKLIGLHAQLRDADEKQRVDMELRTIWKRLAADVGEAIVELGALVWVVLQIIAQQQPVGQFLYVQQMVSRALGQMGSLARQLGNIDEDLANIVDYQRFMERREADVPTKQLPREPRYIAVENVNFTYPKTEKTVLRNVSLNIKSGQHVAIVGENGAGKSTLIKILMGLYAPSRGRVVVDNVSLQDIDIESWHKYIALLGQEYIIYQFATIAENISLGNIAKEAKTIEIEQAVHDAEFDGIVDKLKYGTKTYAQRWMADDNDSETATELSGGQYQRLALARNFYRNAPIIILDEPTSAIDAMAEAKIFKRLFATKKTIIAVSHRLSVVQKADVIYMMKDGRIAESGSYDDLVARDGEFVKMFESQIK